jgi:hypothetical protein
MTRPCLRLALVAGLTAVLGCRNPDTRPYRDPPPPEMKTTVLDYVDSDGFDALFESALVNQDPVITIRTGCEKPDWTGRLNAWIAAWNRGGTVDEKVTTRGQSPLPTLPKMDVESIRELRLLVNGLMDRVEELAKSGASWWQEERVRTRRVALLRPYNLRFHLDADGKIQLIFFNGRYSGHYTQFVQSLTQSNDAVAWTRVIECSACKHFREGPGRLTVRTSEE